MKCMLRRVSFVSALIALSVAQVADARPWPAQTGISATADTAATAGNNPAGMVRFDARANRVELLAFFSENTWEGQLGNGPTFTSDDSSENFAPLGSFVRPINEDWYFGFTILGSAFSEDFGSDWVGRYFIQEYDLINLNAFPSIAYKINEQWSVAASLSIQYTTYEQTKAVPNDPGLPDGQLTVDADGFAAGFATSAMYQLTDKTRFGLTYRSEIDADIDGNGDFSGLGPITESLLDMAGLLGAKVNITSRTPQGVTVGAYHEFDDGGAIAVDAVWIDFSTFRAFRDLRQRRPDRRELDQVRRHLGDRAGLHAAGFGALVGRHRRVPRRRHGRRRESHADAASRRHLGAGRRGRMAMDADPVGLRHVQLHRTRRRAGDFSGRTGSRRGDRDLH